MRDFIPSPSHIDQWLNVVTQRPGASSIQEDSVVCLVEKVCIEVSLRHRNKEFFSKYYIGSRQKWLTDVRAVHYGPQSRWAPFFESEPLRYLGPLCRPAI
jgi:hypothetical protein